MVGMPRISCFFRGAEPGISILIMITSMLTMLTIFMLMLIMFMLIMITSKLITCIV